MSLHIYNPPAPHADPVTGYVDQHQGQRCGQCLSCPRDWLLDCGPVTGLYNQMGGKFRLVRTLSAFKTDFNQVCIWTCAVPIGTGLNPPNGIWSLYYGQYGDGSHLEAWYVSANMSQILANDINGWGPNAITAQPPQAGGHWTQANWHCLAPNVLQAVDGGLGFPNQVQVQPLWA